MEVPLSSYEIVGSIFGLLSVYLTVIENIWCWPTGIISTVAFGILFYQVKLYADMNLQVFFLVTGFQGWYYWRRGGQGQTELPMSTLTRRQMGLLGIGLVISVAIVGHLYQAYTDAHIPFWDAAASGTSVLAQVLLMRKKFENWHLWIAVDVVSIGIYLYKHLYLTTGLYVVFLVLAIGGLLEWQKTLKLAAVAEPA